MSESLNEDMHSKSSPASDCESMGVKRPRNDSDCENSETQDEGTSLRVQVSPSRNDKADESAPSSEITQSSSGKRLRENVKHQDPENPPKHHQPPRDRTHKCRLCNFTSKDQQALEKHLHSHLNQSLKVPSSKMTNAKSYCEACKIQFMSIDTYHVHKQLYCKEMHEKENGSSSPSFLEDAFIPGSDTVIIRNGSGVVNGVIQSTSLIQPQAIYAAISHDPMILIPCSLLNGQCLVPQTGVLPTGAPGIFLQSGIACSTVVEPSSSAAASILKDESLSPRKTSHATMHFSSDVVDRPTSLIQAQAIYAAISHNPLILIPCSLLNEQCLVPQTGVLPTGAQGIVLQSGIACSTVVEPSSSTAASILKDESLSSRKTSHPTMHFSSDVVDRPTSTLRRRKKSEGDVLNLKKSCSGASVRPLDVDVKPKDTESSNSFDQDLSLDWNLMKLPCRSPVNRKDSVFSPVCHSPPIRTSSESGSPHQTSVVHFHFTSSPNISYSNDSVHCFPNTIPSVLAGQSSIDRGSPLPPVPHVDASVEKQLSIPSTPPPKLVKQGNNVCKECNIVFYKYETYLSHKRHYCDFRRRQLSALAASASNNQDHSSDDNNSNHSALNETS